MLGTFLGHHPEAINIIIYIFSGTYIVVDFCSNDQNNDVANPPRAYRTITPYEYDRYEYEPDGGSRPEAKHFIT